MHGIDEVHLDNMMCEALQFEAQASVWLDMRILSYKLNKCKKSD